MSDANSPETPRLAVGVLTRLIVALLLALVLGYVGYLVIALGPNALNLSLMAFVRGEERILQPAELRGPLVRSAQGGADRVYLLTTQSERIVPLRFGRRGGAGRPQQLLHLDVWAFDATTAQPAWRRRLRTFEDRGLLNHEILGVDRGRLWLFVREPIGLALDDGTIRADGARIDAANPALAGKRVDQPGFVAFGAQGLQLTLSDTTQWIIDGTTLAAERREAAAPAPAGIEIPAYAGSSTEQFQVRGVRLGTHWLGMLTAAEAKALHTEPDERRGVVADFLARGHVPEDLRVAPLPYRVWSARVAQVSAAPRGWTKDLPDTWGTRDDFSDYQPLPESPVFLQAGLLSNGHSPQPFWFRDPDSVLVLHHDKVGDAGRLRLTRVSGPAGTVVWDAALPLADLRVTTPGERTLVFVGTIPNAAHDPDSQMSRATHETLVAVDVPSGVVGSYDLTAESVRESAVFP